MNIEINKRKFSVDDEIIEEAVRYTLQRLQEIDRIKDRKNAQISIGVVNKEEIKDINKKWRGKNEETDVLSFCYENTEDKLEGEIVLCLDVITENAQSDGIEMNDELKKNVIHSVLHIAGYEHGEEMFEVQNELVKLLSEEG